MRDRAASLLSESDLGGRPEILRDEIDLGERVGGGQFGDVYSARCRGQRVAVKEIRLRGHLEQEDAVLNEFRNEVAALARLSHPHIVTYMGAVAQDPQHLMIVQDFCPESLEMCVGPKSRGSLHEKLKWLIGVSKGMAWLHESSPPMLHLDLKPAK